MIDAIATIARKELDIDTLETRNSDRLDFHDLSVASVKRALEAAYAAGRVLAHPGQPIWQLIYVDGGRIFQHSGTLADVQAEVGHLELAIGSYVIAIDKSIGGLP